MTGCVTFYDIELKSVNINSDTSECEDAINFIQQVEAMGWFDDDDEKESDVLSTPGPAG